MNTLHAMHRAVIEDPLDLTRRLAAADAFEEAGDTQRALFVRRQCLPHESRPPVGIRWKQWFDPWWDGPTWWRSFGGKRGLPNRVVLFRRKGPGSKSPRSGMWVARGFVSELVMPCDEFLALAGELFARHPVQWVTLSDAIPSPPSPEKLRECPYPDPSSARVWLDRSEMSYDSPHHLPHELFVRLPKVRPGASFAGYPQQWRAEQGLSRACVAYGREAAGLPPLVFPADDAGNVQAFEGCS